MKRLDSLQDVFFEVPKSKENSRYTDMVSLKTFVNITLKGEGSYIVPLDIELLVQLIKCELGDLRDLGDKVNLFFEVIAMTQEAYDMLPEFTGY